MEQFNLYLTPDLNQNYLNLKKVILRKILILLFRYFLVFVKLKKK